MKYILACITMTLIGCEPAERPGGSGPGSWQVVRAAPTEGPALGTGAGPGVPGVSVQLAGDRGFARVTLAVETRGAVPAGGPELYDVLFAVDRAVLLTASPVAAPGSPTTSRVQIRAESGGESSTTFIEPGVPFRAAGAQVAFALAVGPEQSIQAGQETELARWTVQLNTTTTTASLRALLSRQPTGPRLKPENAALR